MSTNFDRRRINGPEESFSPIYASDEEKDVQRSKAGQAIRKGRQPSEIRPICTVCYTSLFNVSLNSTPVLKTGLISQANGSAYIETERTKIACAMLVNQLLNSSVHIHKITDMALDNRRQPRTARRGSSMWRLSLHHSLARNEERL